MSKDFGALLAMYGTFLAVCGTAGAALHGWEKKAMHSMYAGLGGFAAMLFCSILSAMESKVPVAIGVHVALILILVFVAVFGIQAYRSFGDDSKFDRLVLFIIMGAGSVVALAKAISMKPKSKKQ
eukprot:TRINITY_DN7506_c8_g1_i1.p1 TRINITY_DN7506_c8_g1~~TRINITY_DN7506_c8_g1_i1.p1  ORF type:complete len:125 (-),score=42.07 TRINITY_DN7506_c8_g1_i1:56-430(-)